MTPDEIDRILNSEEELQPSGAFARNVMAAVRREAEQPEPVRFPWWRFLAGIAASGGMGVGGTALLLQSDVLTAPVPDVVQTVVFAFAMLLLSLGLAAMPRVMSRP